MPTLIINPRSGGGKAARFDLIAQCARRGIEPIVFEPGDHLAALAETAIRNGADAVGWQAATARKPRLRLLRPSTPSGSTAKASPCRRHFCSSPTGKRCASGSRRAGDEVRTRLSELLLVFGPGVRTQQNSERLC